MQEEFEIDIYDTNSSEENAIQLPMNYVSVGSVENDDVKVYIQQDVFKRLEKYSASDVEHELGSILLGQYAQSMGKTYVVISAYIEAKYTDASATTLTFTHETWDYVYKVQEKDYPDLKILGWQHTHPGYGIFLSNYDIFIQENFFNRPFQVAYVIDPKQKHRGFFQWHGDKVEKLKGFFIYDEVGKPVKVDLTEKKENSAKSDAGAIRSKPWLSYVLSAVVVLLAFVVVRLSSEIKLQQSNQERLDSIVVAQNEMLQELRNETLAHEDTAGTEASKALGDVSFVKYEVKKGDTLVSICKESNLDFSKNIKMIQSMNGIDNLNKIHVGQIIILPCYNGEGE